MKTENVAESHQTDIPYTFPAGHETTVSHTRLSDISVVDCFVALQHLELLCRSHGRHVYMMIINSKALRSLGPAEGLQKYCWGQ